MATTVRRGLLRSETRALDLESDIRAAYCERVVDPVRRLLWIELLYKLD